MSKSDAATRQKNWPNLHKKYLREQEELEIAEDLQSLEIKYRPGYKAYLKSPQHDLELFLDRLDNERRARTR